MGALDGKVGVGPAAGAGGCGDKAGAAPAPRRGAARNYGSGSVALTAAAAAQYGNRARAKASALQPVTLQASPVSVAASMPPDPPGKDAGPPAASLYPTLFPPLPTRTSARTHTRAHSQEVRGTQDRGGEEGAGRKSLRGDGDRGRGEPGQSVTRRASKSWAGEGAESHLVGRRRPPAGKGREPRRGGRGAVEAPGPRSWAGTRRGGGLSRNRGVSRWSRRGSPPGRAEAPAAGLGPWSCSS